MIIDFHTHIYPPAVKNNREKYIAADPCFAALYSHPEAAVVTADELIESMDKNGIDVSVALNFGWTSQRLCAETNDYIMESVARYPGRLVGFCSVLPADPSAASEIERCVKEGIKGVGELRPDIISADLEDKDKLRPFISALVENGLILLLHASEPVGHPYAGKGTATPGTLYPFIYAYPELKMVLAHWGGGLPFYALMPEVNKALANIYYDTAATPYLYSSSIYKQVGELVGAEKILFGTDYPLMSQQKVIRHIDSQDMTEDTRELIFSGNARTLLGI